MLSRFKSQLLACSDQINTLILKFRYPRVSFGFGVRIGWQAVLRPCQGSRAGVIRVGGGCEIQDGSWLETWGGSIELQENTFIGPYVVIYGHGGVRIGKGCLVSMHCRILSSNHAIPPIGIPIRTAPDVVQPTVIEDDVWLGAGATVLSGVRIHLGSIIGAGSVVTNDIPANAIAVGVPARVIRYRQTEALVRADL